MNVGQNSWYRVPTKWDIAEQVAGERPAGYPTGGGGSPPNTNVVSFYHPPPLPPFSLEVNMTFVSFLVIYRNF